MDKDMIYRFVVRIRDFTEEIWYNITIILMIIKQAVKYRKHIS